LIHVKPASTAMAVSCWVFRPTGPARSSQRSAAMAGKNTPANLAKATATAAMVPV